MSDSSYPAVIESEHAQTRARLGSPLDELTRRLSPGQLLDEGLSYVRNGQGAEFVRNLGAQVRDNPLPVTLAGVGIAWLVFAGTQRGKSVSGSPSRAVVPYTGEEAGRQTVSGSLADRARRAGEAISRNAGETEAAFRERVADARAATLGVMRQAQETASGFMARVQEAFDATQSSARDGIGAVRETAGQWTDRLSETARQGSAAVGDLANRGRDYAARANDYAARAGDYASDAGKRMAQTGESIVDAVADNPIVLGALGLAVGALLGAWLPRTSQEDAYLGKAAGQVADSAREVASDLVERGARVGDAIVTAAGQAIREESTDLAPGTSRQATPDPESSRDAAQGLPDNRVSRSEAGPETEHSRA